jgi:hypothetical protein
MLINPFGPSIYVADISEEFLSFLKEGAENSVDASHISDLAGNIVNQRTAVLQPNTFVHYIHPHIKEYVDENFKRYGDREPPDSISYDLGNGPWINYQKKHEFNPIHVHDGVLSAVIFIDIPEEIEKEHVFWEDKTNCPSPGMLEFVYGPKSFMSNGSYKVTPKTGQMYIFPADLKHCVYPFTSDVTRITMSFNIFDLQFH